MKHDFLIVGAGFFGSTMARILTDAGKSCLVIDKNMHLAGTAYDKLMDGIMVSQYGAHIFHTNNNEVWNFVQQFGEMTPYINKPKVIAQNKIYSFPLNLMTFYQLWGVKTPTEAEAKLNEVKIYCKNPTNCEDWILSMVGREIYELFFYGYTKKQWMREPRDLPPSIFQRLPIRLTFEENYFTTKYQAIPTLGFTSLIENMLSGINFDLGVDFFSKDWSKIANHIIFTGPIDKFFNYKLGKLDYNTLRFEYKTVAGDYQGTAVTNHTDIDVPYLRIIEHQHFRAKQEKHNLSCKQNLSVISYDLPISYNDHPEPYYPIASQENLKLYNKYKQISSSNVTFGGRLGEYRYFDLDQTIASAMAKSKKFL